jgi:Domain of unknown function (DUF4388)
MPHVADVREPWRQSCEMLTGDLSTMSLADVLQWADSTRGRGLLTIARPSGALWMQIADRHVVGCVRPSSRGVLPQRLAAHRERGKLELDAQALALEMLYDQFLVQDDEFRFELDGKPAETGVALEIALQEIVMVGMQYVDEWAELRGFYPSGHARVRRIQAKQPDPLSATQRALLVIAELELTLSEARLSLGISQPALLRNVDTLRRLGCVLVDGAPEAADLTEQFVHKTMMLVREKQFDEAAHVFAALLSTDPGSHRIRELLQMVEREQIADLYAEVPARAIVRRRLRLAGVESRLTAADRALVERVDDRRDVATLVLASPLREVETLKSVRKLHRMEAVELLLPEESSLPGKTAPA